MAGVWKPITTSLMVSCNRGNLYLWSCVCAMLVSEICSSEPDSVPCTWDLKKHESTRFQRHSSPFLESQLCGPSSFDLNFVLYFIALHNQTLTIGHLLANFVEFAGIRGKYYSLNMLQQVPTVGNYISSILTDLRQTWTSELPLGVLFNNNFNNN